MDKMGGYVLEPPAEKVSEAMNFDVIKPDEVRAMYEQAADKRLQVSIMADLMACEEADICDLLGIEHTKKRKRGYIVEAEALKMHRNGATTKEIANAFDVTPDAVKAWKWRNGLVKLSEAMKAKQAQFRQFYDQNMTDAQIAAATGEKRETVCVWRKQNKLPAHTLRCQNWEECDEIYLPMYEKGMTDSQIAEACGVNPWNVRDWRQKRILVANRIPGRSGGRKPRKDRENEDALIRPLYERGLSDTQIEKETGITRRAVCEWRRKFNLPVNGRKFQ